MKKPVVKFTSFFSALSLSLACSLDLFWKNLAHGSNPMLVGKNVMKLKDYHGLPSIENFKKGAV